MAQTNTWALGFIMIHSFCYMIIVFVAYRGFEHFARNRPFPSSKQSHFQNEAKCETFVVKMSFICIIIKNHFHINGFALSLALKVRFFGTRKWPIRKKYSVLRTHRAKTSTLIPSSYCGFDFPI